MRFFIVDDDAAIRFMLRDIIEDYDLGEVMGEAENGSLINSSSLIHNKIDILIIDLLMPIRDGLETVKAITPDFTGKIIMLSQLEDKEMIGKAYALGVEYYITKPINRLEVVGILQKVIDNLKLRDSIFNIQKAINQLSFGNTLGKQQPLYKSKSITSCAQHFLTELGIVTEAGAKDLVDIINFLHEYDNKHSLESQMSPLKDIFTSLSIKRLGTEAGSELIKKEIKASEQRVRRAISQALNHIASLGLTDYTNPKFEEYSTKFFDFSEVRKKMLELEEDNIHASSSVHVNIKKFVRVLYLEAKILLQD